MRNYLAPRAFRRKSGGGAILLEAMPRVGLGGNLIIHFRIGHFEAENIFLKYGDLGFG